MNFQEHYVNLQGVGSGKGKFVFSSFLHSLGQSHTAGWWWRIFPSIVEKWLLSLIQSVLLPPPLSQKKACIWFSILKSAWALAWMCIQSGLYSRELSGKAKHPWKEVCRVLGAGEVSDAGRLDSGKTGGCSLSCLPLPRLVRHLWPCCSQVGEELLKRCLIRCCWCN